MAGVQPGSNSRGRGGKFRKFTRGGGKHFSRDLRPVDADGNEISMWSADAQRKRGGKDSEEEDSEEEEEEDSEEDSDEDSDSKPKTAQGGEVSREERKQAAKARKAAAIAKKKAAAIEVGDLPPSDSEEDSDDGPMPANPNHSKAARNQTQATTTTVEDVTNGVAQMTASNRKERETAAALAARENYMRLHEQGKTDEAKADLARLKLIREQREAEAARRQAEKEEKEAQEQARRAEFEAKEAKKRDSAMGKKKSSKSK